MNPLLIYAAVSALAGLAKSHFSDKPKAEQQRKLAAKTQELSPWTGLRANPIQEADPFGTALQFGTTGAMMGANMENADANKMMAEKMKSGYSPNSSPWGFNNSAPAAGTGYLGGNYKFKSNYDLL